jgi:TonB family protein
MGKLAAEAAERIQSSGKKRVVVADFAGPHDAYTELGRVLADDFSSALALAAKDLEVLRRDALKNVMGPRELSPVDLRDDKTAVETARGINADLLVTGELEETDKTIGVTIVLLDVAAARRIGAAAIHVPRTESVSALLAKQLYRLRPGRPGGPVLVEGAYLPSRGGVGAPKCVSCPNPRYTEQASRAKYSGIVVLQFVVTEDGRTRDIKIVRGLGFGLDEAAIEAVKQWRLTPAPGPDGKAVPVRTVAEISFNVK